MYLGQRELRNGLRPVYRRIERQAQSRVPAGKHVLSMLMNEYRQAYGPDAAAAVSEKLKGHYGR
ncbi:hypothetical protein BXT84_07975 [Sulfobacillus thermotolerans]|uniref:Uncharacterized protein n=1 Tax=Sulfobacillus thermotolerans TaxID=338644 RepID=A0ABN5H005_9FIRM|nr:hypothetical protein BXT84_07975 [Sulfobacillus thermotolerans]